MPGRVLTTEPTAMIALSKVISSVTLPSESLTEMALGPVNSPQPLNSVILFFFMRKWMPLTMRADTSRERLKALPKSTVMSPPIPKVLASLVTMWASSALRKSDLVGMQPTLRQTPPQYSFSMMAVFLPSWAARMAAT